MHVIEDHETFVCFFQWSESNYSLTMIPKTILFGLVIILIAYYYDPIVWKRLVKKLLKEEPWEVRIANAWDQQITEPHLQKKRIAVG